jgi:hypothetical protein
MRNWFENKPFTSGIIFIILFIAIEQIDANYFNPNIKEKDLQQRIDCHDSQDKCWFIDLKQRANEK